MARLKNYSSEYPLRLHIYSLREDGLPGEELLKKQVIFSETNFKKGILEVDIKEQNIILDRTSFFVGVQWINKSTNELLRRSTGQKSDNGVGETSLLSERLTYRRGRVLNFKWYMEFEKGIFIPGNANEKGVTTPIPLKGNPINILASAVIETF